MRTKTLFAVALTLLALSPSQATAHRFGHPTVPQNEFLFGLGWADPREESVFNIEIDNALADPALEPAVTYQFVFYHNTSDHLALGLHFSWTSQDLGWVPLVDETNTPFDVFFDIRSYNLGARSRFTFVRSVFSPYAYVGMSYAFGDLRGNDPYLRNLGYDGFSVVTGIGTSIVSAEWLQISAEAFFAPGWASWDGPPPFANSTSRDFDPSMLGVLGNVTLRF